VREREGRGSSAAAGQMGQKGMLGRWRELGRSSRKGGVREVWGLRVFLFKKTFSNLLKFKLFSNLNTTNLFQNFQNILKTFNTSHQHIKTLCNQNMMHKHLLLLKLLK
jgi:hypothetical protein